jgi:hypothetical protein
MARKRSQAEPSSSQSFEISARVARQARVVAFKREARAPVSRPLRIYSLDPSVSDRLGGVAVVQVPYEKLELGPVGALFDIRCDGAPKALNAEPLDLDDPFLLMSNGLAPTPANGRFHLQMIYAVCSLTYAVFKRALGREIAWAIEPAGDGPLRLQVFPFVPGANAGYSREGGGLTFGFFKASRRAAGFTVQGGLISTALSHDVIAHETTHALLDGLRSSFMDPTNVDVPAFHEGFSDLVALFLHFTYVDVVERAIRESRGTLARGSLLSDIAREFGYARAGKGRRKSRTEASGGTPQALRSGVDVAGVAGFDSDIVPSAENAPTQYDPALEPHALGSVLVSAVFEAFVTIVRRKCERLLRIAGVDPRSVGQAELSDALVKAIAQEASDVAGQFLNVCIRAIDYCPPTDMELGEYLRAIITADGDIERTDKWGFREALMRSFRRRGIFPDHVQFMTEDAVRWQPPPKALTIPDLAFRKLRFGGEPGQPADVRELERQARALGAFVTDPVHADCFKLVPQTGRRPKGIVQASPAIVQSVRVTRRVAPDGRIAFDLVGEVTQSCTVERAGAMFDMHGGCTVIIDPEGHVRYAIYKKFDSENRRARQQAAMRGALKRFWMKSGRGWKPRGDVLKHLHSGR